MTHLCRTQDVPEARFVCRLLLLLEIDLINNPHRNLSRLR